MSDKNPKLVACAQHFVQEETDVIVYAGSIARLGYERFCKAIGHGGGKKLLLVLSTFGGDPDAGYRIARAAIHHYGAANFSILIPKYCKSAGTLICIGATKLIMANQAELGPLDIQLRKDGELFQQSSGLDILRGMTYLQDEALTTFNNYLLDINGGSGLSTKIASEIASKLVIGLYQPLFSQVDPLKLGEIRGALEIARSYGERLDSKSKSLASNSALNDLIVSYPTHGFVIDRSEAREIFKNVSAPDDFERVLCEFVRENQWPPGAASATVLNFLQNFAPAATAVPAAPTLPVTPAAASVASVTPVAPESLIEEKSNESATNEKSETSGPAEEPGEQQRDHGGVPEVNGQQHDAARSNEGDAPANEGSATS